uniref:DNA polymerase beta n=1 Tax=viral metagenome TaxID=1070528 RepID=A0A6C0JQN9_9ZZZZ
MEQQTDEEKLVTMIRETKVSPMTPSLEKKSEKLGETKDDVLETPQKRKKLIIKGTIHLPEQSISVLPSQPLIEKTEKTLEEMPRYNETFIEVLERLATLMNKKGDYIRSRVYTRAQDTIRNIQKDITSISDLDGKPNIGPIIKEKLTEYLETGTLQLFEREKDKPEYLLSEIYGVGPKKAKDLVEKGITTIEQLRERQDELLNDVQRAGLKYYEDILERIPRSEIDEYNDLFKTAFDKVSTPESRYEIVGSYRRGAHTSGDIDAIITSDDSTMFSKFIDILKEKEVILEVLSCGKTKCLVIARLPNRKTARRVDFMYTSQEEYPFAVLYFTGSKTFNTVMRGHALKMGVSLNEHGLYTKKVGKEKEQKVDTIFKDEKDIFDYLHLQYKEPVDRIDGRSIIIRETKVSPMTPSLLNIGEIKPVKEKKTRKLKEPKPPKEPKTRKIREPKVPKEPKPPKVPKEPKPKKIKVPKVPKEPKTKKIREPKPEKKTRKKKLILDNEKEIEKVKAEFEETLKPVIEVPKPEIEEQPIIPVIPLEIEAEAAIDIKTVKKERKTRKIKEPKEPKPEKGTRKKKITIVPMEKIIVSPKKDLEITTENKEKPKKMTSKSEAKQNIKLFQEKGITHIEGLNEKQITEMIVSANDAYYNSRNTLMTDNEYDIVKEYAMKKFPNNNILLTVGAPIEKNKVTLPYNMPSMDKIKPDTNALISWISKYKGPYVLSCKLDGVSGMYTTDGDEPKLYTRGDGNIGQDISHLLRVLKLPLKKEGEKGTVVRGEFIIPKAVFEEKYKDKFANPRNLVSGIINSKTLDDKTMDLHFVTYEVIQPLIKPSEQMNLLKSLNHEVVQNKLVDELSNEQLSDLLIDWRTHYQYEIDGVIVTDDNMHSRKDGNPEYAFAFKMVISDQMAEAKVVDVLWNASKSGYLKPRVRIEPIKLGGVTIEYATGFNGSFIESNKIGIGAVIQIIRSGDVIPYIKSVTTPAEHAKMPDVKYHWTDTHVDIVLDDISEDTGVREKEITAFFTGLDVEGLSSGNVKRIIKAGFNSIPAIIKMTKADFKGVEGFKEKMIEKVHTSIHDKLEKASLLEIMAASNKFGRGIGERKIRPILDEYPDILTRSEKPDDKITLLKGIKGIGKENAKAFVDHIDDFMGFLKECGLEGKLEGVLEKPIENTFVQSFDISHPLYQKHIVMTKVRDQTIIDGLKRVGGVLDDGIGKNTFVLVVKTKEDVSNKTKYASEHGIPIMTPAEFIAKYL